MEGPARRDETTVFPLTRADAAAMAGLALAVLACSWPFATLRQVFYQVDLAFMDHPLRAHAFEHLRHGEFPFWCAHLLAGFPLFAEGQAALLHPVSWLYLALPREAALNATILFHQVTLALGAYLFLRQRSGRVPAALGAATVTFSSFALVMHVLPGFLAVIAATPWLLFCGQRFVDHGRPRWLAAAAAVVATMHFAGDPLGTWLAALLFAACMLASGAAGWRRRLLALLVPLVLGSLLAAVQLAPTAAFLAESTRADAGRAAAPREHFLPASLALTAWSPRFHGERFSSYRGPQPPVWEEGLLFFTGFTTLLLAPLGLSRDRASALWSAVALLAVATSSRELHAVAGWLWGWPPFAFFRWPGHVLLWFVVAAAVLAARGLERVLSGQPLGRGRLAAAGAIVGFGLAAIAFTASADAGLAGARREDALALALASLVGGTAVAARHRLGRPATAAAFFAILAGGVALGPRPEGLAADAYARAEAEIARLAPGLGAEGRLLPLQVWDAPSRPQDAESFHRVARAAPPNLHLLAGLAATAQFDLRHTATLWRSRAALAEPGPRVLDLLGVERVVGPADGFAPDWLAASYEACVSGPPVVWCRRAPAPRAFLAREWVVASAEQALARLTRGDQRDPRSWVTLESAPRWLPSRDAAREDRAEIVARDGRTVTIDVSAREPALLVLAEAWAGGWRARIGADAAPALVAHGFLRAVTVPAGRHRVEWRYQPPGLSAGLWTSLLAAVGWIWLASRGSTW